MAAFHTKMRLLESFWFFACLPLPLWAAYDVPDLQLNEVDFLQRALEMDSPTIRRWKASPMFWLHIPKCGGSFFNAVLHMPGACPGLGANVSIDDEQFGKCFEINFRLKCPTLCNQALVHCDGPMPHTDLEDEKYDEFKGHFVALFRQPEQRLLSAWNDDEDVFRAEPTIPRCAPNRTAERYLTMEEFTEKMGGKATSQIVGKKNVTEADVPVAKQRLREGFAFVGLQEEWPLSICLFHAKFGGPCRRMEFLDVRPNDHSTNTTSQYDVSILNGWIDKVDRPVYAEAVRIFQEDLVKYDVSPTTCRACYEEAGLEV